MGCTPRAKLSVGWDRRQVMSTVDRRPWSKSVIYDCPLLYCNMLWTVLSDSIEPTKFRELVSKLQKFISCRLFPQNEDDLPPVSKCAWWIPCVTKVMALLS